MFIQDVKSCEFMEKVNGTSQLCYAYVSSVSWSNDPIKGMKYALNGYIHCT